MRTLVLIYAAGAVATIALRARGHRREPARLALEGLFWPFFLPAALGGGGAGATDVEARLLQALARLGGPAEHVLGPEIRRVRAAVDALAGTRARLADSEALLTDPAFDRARAERTLADLHARGCPDADPRIASVRARLEEIDRLGALRTQALDDLERAELKMEELCAKVQLLAFSDHPRGDALALIREVAIAVEAVNETLNAT